MSLSDTSAHAGTSSNSIQLLFSGQVSEGIASSLGTTAAAVQKFINGQGSEGLASAVGISSSELQHLRNDLGKDGAIGFILGLAVGLPNESA